MYSCTVYSMFFDRYTTGCTHCIYMHLYVCMYVHLCTLLCVHVLCTYACTCMYVCTIYIMYMYIHCILYICTCIYVTARLAAQPVSKPASPFQSRPACFEMGWPNSQPLKDNGPLRNWLGVDFKTGWVDGFETGWVDTGQLIRRYETGWVDTGQLIPTYALIVRTVAYLIYKGYSAVYKYCTSRYQANGV